MDIQGIEGCNGLLVRLNKRLAFPKQQAFPEFLMLEKRLVFLKH
jgi:hypothetical protein